MKECAGIPAGTRQLANRRPLALESWIRDAGRQQTAYPYYRVSGANVAVPRFSLQYTVAGEGRLVYRGAELQLLPGTLMLLGAPADYVYDAPPGTVWEFLYVTLDGPAAQRLGRRAEALCGPVLRLTPDDPVLVLFLSLLRRIMNDHQLDAWENSESAHALLMRLLRHGASVSSQPHRLEAAVCNAIEYARQHLAEPIDVDALAACANLSRYHFSRIFKQHTGLPPGEFLLRERLQSAVELLQTTPLLVREIARQSGFADPVHFSKIFHRRIGLSPQEFRIHNQCYPAT